MPTDEQQREQFEADTKEALHWSTVSFDREELRPDEYAHRPMQYRWLGWQAAHRSRDAEVQALERVALNVMASLDAALSILGRSHEGKVPANEAVASDRMFTMMLDDYQKSLDAARAALAGEKGSPDE